MKILFLNPPFKVEHGKYSRTSRTPAITKSGTVYYPIWLCYAAAAVEQGGHEITVIDSCANQYDRMSTLDMVTDFAPDMVILDTSTASIFDDVEMGNISRNAVLLGDSLKKTVSLRGGKILPIPASPLPKHMLIRYLGISLTDLALGLSATQISQPIVQGDNIYLLQVIENQPATLMPFEQVRETVMTELISRQRRDSLTTTLKKLKQNASIQFNLSLLEQLASTDK